MSPSFKAKTPNKLAFMTGIGLLAASLLCATPTMADQGSVVIVQGNDLEQVKSAVALVGGKIVDEIKLINAVGVVLTDEQQQQLQAMKGITHFYQDYKLETAGKKSKSFDLNSLLSGSTSTSNTMDSS